MALHMHAKAYVGSHGGGNILTFPNLYIFHIKMGCSSPKFRSCAIKYEINFFSITQPLIQRS